MLKPFARLLVALAATLAAAGASASDVKVAVAANFTDAAREIAAAYAAKTGNHAVLSFGSSGQFYAQITQGAPFEILLSADADRPTRLEREGLAVSGTRFTYARGALVLWSANPALVDDKGAVLARGTFSKLAIADPEAAPYGLAAVQVIQHMGLSARLKPRLVKGASITQTEEFVRTGAAELGFLALSQTTVLKGGSNWRPPETWYAPINQQAVLLWKGERDPAAKSFLAFLRGPEAAAIMRKYGYR
jgi:molybdate transport system substrate-binding protein